MIFRHQVTKGFDWGLVSRSMLIENSIILTKLERKYGSVDRLDYSSEIIKSFPDSISLNINTEPIRDLLVSNTKLASILVNENSDINSLDSIFKNKDADSVLADENIDIELRKTAAKMFSNINPLTQERDVFKSSKYSSFIPIVTITGTFPPQQDSDGNSLFNPSGTVTVAEFLDSLNAIKFRSSSSLGRKKSIDNISNEKDYFNEGYTSCLDGYSSYFYNLYTRKELMEPITRLELAYITVLCWSSFINKFGKVHSGSYKLGLTFDWLNYASELLNDFEDGFDYRVTQRLLDDGQIISVNIKDYMNSKGISDLKQSIKDGINAIPYPMFMSLLELYNLGVFYFDSSRLEPIKEVSRGELSYFIVKIASTLNKEL